ncbi:type II toxin-antitoxin system VapC family toxin [Halobacterium sp. R2-5]|uniref:type II toxin-antitoxin system VapC family toxin n=1 Tax=Halobacterium sp. R2-5 TaxID=2715751 RepID=UPI00141FB5CA|nr:type II toxin-antitoxin system VapC family toxin [Halobacterium sp. R2-5]NIB98478.1 type II toxin-antitoxin system VapC family toxin [Halobacterium sp. R2-5]
MTVLVDTGVVYADHDTDAARHEEASEALDAVYDGVLGQPYVSDYVYDEAVTLTAARGDASSAKRLGERLRGAGRYPEAYELLRVSEDIFEDAIDVFEQYDDHRLSFTDATTIAAVERRGLDGVLSFDDDFAGLVERFEPATVGERAAE